MGIVNRTMDASQQRDQINIMPASGVAGSIAGVVDTGATGILWIAPYPCVLEMAKITAHGVSSTPKWSLCKVIWIAGTGVTFVPITGASAAPLAVGTSGPAGFSLPATTSSLVQLAAGDMLSFITGVANTATVQPVISLVVRKLQDIVTHYGL